MFTLESPFNVPYQCIKIASTRALLLCTHLDPDQTTTAYQRGRQIPCPAIVSNILAHTRPILFEDTPRINEHRNTNLDSPAAHQQNYTPFIS